MPVKIPIVFYSMYGHFYEMAEAAAQGARQLPGADGSRPPSENELEISQYQEPLFAEVARRLKQSQRPSCA